VRSGREPAVIRLLKRIYAVVLGPSLRHPRVVLIPAVAMLAAALAALPRLGQGFLPEFNEGTLTIRAVTLPGTSLAQSDELGRIVERILLARPEATGVARRTGRAELDEHAQGVESSEIDVTFRLRGSETKAAFLAGLREDFSLVPGMNITIGQPISHRIDHMLSGGRANVAVKIFGDDLMKLRALGSHVQRVMASVPGVVDLTTEPQVDIPILKIGFDRAAIARCGLTIRDVATTVETAFRGQTVSRVLEGRNAFDLVVRVGDPATITVESVENLPVDTPSGAKLPLRALAQIRRSTGPNQISRENVQRKFVVTCNVAGRDLRGVVREVDRRVRQAVRLDEGPYRGYYIEYGGQFQSAEETTRLLTLLTIAVVVGIGLLLHLAFSSARDALLVMVNLPLALIGGVVGVFVTGGVLSVASLVGFITLFGIATRNGIMLVAHIRHLQQQEGVSDFGEAVYRGAMERLAPILMTALSAGLALVPLALGGERPGNEIQTPMAIVILCGLLSSTALNMVVLPTLYLRFGRPTVPVGPDAADELDDQCRTLALVP
jgi:Cu/Ag efflux pump CusA